MNTFVHKISSVLGITFLRRELLTGVIGSNGINLLKMLTVIYSLQIAFQTYARYTAITVYTLSLYHTP